MKKFEKLTIILLEQGIKTGIIIEDGVTSVDEQLQNKENPQK